MKKGRPCEFNKDEVIDIASHLFSRKGYDATSLNELLEEMKISRGSFYYAFNSKYQLFELCVHRLRDRQIAMAMEELQQAANGRCFIENLLNEIVRTPVHKEKESSFNGFLMNTAFESSEHNPKISILISNASLRFAEIFRLAVERGQSENVISKQKNAYELAFYFLSSIAGLRAMIKANADRRYIRNVIIITLAALN